jgi:hypothetical protein
LSSLLLVATTTRRRPKPQLDVWRREVPLDVSPASYGRSQEVLRRRGVGRLQGRRDRRRGGPWRGHAAARAAQRGHAAARAANAGATTDWLLLRLRHDLGLRCVCDVCVRMGRRGSHCNLYFSQLRNLSLAAVILQEVQTGRVIFITRYCRFKSLGGPFGVPERCPIRDGLWFGQSGSLVGPFWAPKRCQRK